MSEAILFLEIAAFVAVALYVITNLSGGNR